MCALTIAFSSALGSGWVGVSIHTLFTIHNTQQFSVGILLLLPVFPFIAKYTVQDGSYYFAPNIHPSWVAIAVKHQTDTDEYALGHDIVFTTNPLAGRKLHRCT